LVQVLGLRVIARTSAFAFKGKQRDIRRIGEALGVDHLLEGSVRRAGDRVRITAQLIAAKDGCHLWSERYDREIADVFAIQDEIARTIAKVLEVKLSVASESRSHHTPNAEAYENFLKARHQAATIDLVAIKSALERLFAYLDRAIELDPKFAAPHALRGTIFWMAAFTSRYPAHEMVPRAKAALSKALEIDPEQPHAHAVLGLMALIYEFDRGEADRRFQRATAHPAFDAWTGVIVGQFLAFAGRAREAPQYLQPLLLEDPLNAGAHHLMAFVHDIAGAHHEAEAEYRRTWELDEHYFFTGEGLAINQLYQNKVAEALAAAERGYALAPWNQSTAGILAGLRRRT